MVKLETVAGMGGKGSCSFIISVMNPRFIYGLCIRTLIMHVPILFLYSIHATTVEIYSRNIIPATTRHMCLSSVICGVCVAGVYKI